MKKPLPEEDFEEHDTSTHNSEEISGSGLGKKRRRDEKDVSVEANESKGVGRKPVKRNRSTADNLAPSSSPSRPRDPSLSNRYSGQESGSDSDHADADRTAKRGKIAAHFETLSSAALSARKTADVPDPADSANDPPSTDRLHKPHHLSTTSQNDASGSLNAADGSPPEVIEKSSRSPEQEALAAGPDDFTREIDEVFAHRTGFDGEEEDTPISKAIRIAHSIHRQVYPTGKLPEFHEDTEVKTASGANFKIISTDKFIGHISPMIKYLSPEIRSKIVADVLNISDQSLKIRSISALTKHGVSSIGEKDRERIFSFSKEVLSDDKDEHERSETLPQGESLRQHAADTLRRLAKYWPDDLKEYLRSIRSTNQMAADALQDSIERVKNEQKENSIEFYKTLSEFREGKRNDISEIYGWEYTFTSTLVKPKALDTCVKQERYALMNTPRSRGRDARD